MSELLVAPHASAWIETCIISGVSFSSHVAPHAGAWIETAWISIFFMPDLVAPHADAWIETSKYDKRVELWGSHPMRVRGLKQWYRKRLHQVREVAPHAGAWIETSISLLNKHLLAVAPPAFD